MTKIEWTDATWNPVTGCTPISAGCANCYAKRMASRLRGRYGYPADDPFAVTLHPDRLERPLKWRKPRRVFVCSMGDLFHRKIHFGDIATVFDIMAQTPEHTYQVLTKRPEQMREFFKWYRVDYGSTSYYWPFPNVWLGVTAENQRTADERIPILLQIPAAVRFVSVEPMLESIFLYTRKCKASLRCPMWVVAEGGCGGCAASTDPGLDWAICGAETGPGKRPMDLGWARSLRDQCTDAGVPFFFKKDSRGNRKLDGRLWEEMPK